MRQTKGLRNTLQKSATIRGEQSCMTATDGVNHLLSKSALESAIADKLPRRGQTIDTRMRKPPKLPSIAITDDFNTLNNQLLTRQLKESREELAQTKAQLAQAKS